MTVQQENVTYHGSISAAHGPARVLCMCDCDECQEHDLFRWELITEQGQHLIHVRPESFA